MTFYAQCVTYTKCWNVLFDPCAILWQIIKRQIQKYHLLYIYIHDISSNTVLDKTDLLKSIFLIKHCPRQVKMSNICVKIVRM